MLHKQALWDICSTVCVYLYVFDVCVCVCVRAHVKIISSILTQGAISQQWQDRFQIGWPEFDTLHSLSVSVVTDHICKHTDTASSVALSS